MLTEYLQTRRKDTCGTAARGERLCADDVLGLVADKGGLSVDDPLRWPEDHQPRGADGLCRRVAARGDEPKLGFGLAGFRRRRWRLSRGDSGKHKCEGNCESGSSKVCMHARSACNPYASDVRLSEKRLHPRDLSIELAVEFRTARALVHKADLHIDRT